MLYIPKTDDYLKISTEGEEKDLLVKILVNILSLENQNCTLKFVKSKI